MATYAIGDLQGCYDPLRRLLDRVGFDPGADGLWLTGDLVNRGPRSLEALRFVKGLGASAVPVLGNHDLHLLRRAEGLAPGKRLDTLDPVLSAPDRDELTDWLRRRPLLHRDRGYVLVHAGLLPQWSMDKAAALAREAESRLRAPDYRDFLRDTIAHEAVPWSEDLDGPARGSCAVGVLTRLRCCTARGEVEASFSGPPADAPEGFRPWFHLRREPEAETILFGHWSALGLHFADRAVCLDSGCVWGGPLTALRLDDSRVFQVPRDG